MSQELMNRNGIAAALTPVHEESYVVGVDIGGSNLRLAVADHCGNIAARWSTSTSGIKDAQRIVDLIRSGVDQLLQEMHLSPGALRAIAAGAPGVTNVDSGVVIATSYLMGWRNIPLRDLLEAAFDLPAAVDNDVNLAALGEQWAGAAQGMSNCVFLAIGTGVGAGIILNGRLFRGDNWIAGEIGYMLVPGASEEPVERGKPGALEGLVGGEGIQGRWQQEWSEAAGAPRELSATEVFDHAMKGNSLAQAILSRTARSLMYCIYNISLVLNCPLFVLGGSVGLHPALREATERMLAERGSRVQPKLMSSALGADAQLIGAIALALQTARSRREVIS